jgi:hypothetical protein
MALRRLPIGFTGAIEAMRLLGTSPTNSHVEVGPDALEVRTGAAFRATVPA